jgi:hypothetical protein
MTIEIEDIKKISLVEGEALMIQIPKDYNQIEAKRLMSILREAFPKHHERIFITKDKLELTAITLKNGRP